MKKTKKLSAMLLASIMTAGTVSSLSAGALAYFNSKEEMDEIIENSFKVPVDSFMTPFTPEWYVSSRVYLAETEHPNVYAYYCIDGASPNVVSADFITDIDDDTISKAIEEICPDVEYIKIISDSNSNAKRITLSGVDATVHPRFNVYEEMRKKDVTYKQAQNIYDWMSKNCEVQNFKYTQKTVSPSKTNTSLNEYITMNGDVNNKELIDNYIDEKNLDWSTSLEDDDYVFRVEIGQTLSAEEKYQIVEQIYNDLGMRPSIIIPTLGSYVDDIVIEMHANIKGDANNDGNLALSDAITIMQTIGNPDVYKLTAQGEYNADIAGDSDGITNLDALTVQRKLLKLE